MEVSRSGYGKKGFLDCVYFIYCTPTEPFILIDTKKLKIQKLLGASVVL